MIAEILATGEEIRTGALVDTNSAFAAGLLDQRGIVVSRHHTVGDDSTALAQVIAEISKRADVAVVTGGLGPTVDDRTVEAAAQVAGVPLIMDARAMDEIERFFKRIGRPCSPTNRKQAMIPQGAKCLYNPIGTAPGVQLTINRCVFFFLPGVPREMKQMFNDQVLPQISALQGDRHRFNLVRTISTFGLSESVVGERIAAIAVQYPQITLGLRAKSPEIQVKLYLQTEDESAGRQILDAAGQQVGEILGRHVFSHDGRSMAEEVGRLLKHRQATLALAESCTGGLVANWLTNIAGSSDYFLFSAVTYHNDAKVRVLGVLEETLQHNGAVSEETARQMAEGARRLSGATCGLAITGIAGPGGGSEEKPVGTVCMALATAEMTVARRLFYSFGQRLMNKRIFAMAALDMLRRRLEDDAA